MQEPANPFDIAVLIRKSWNLYQSRWIQIFWLVVVLYLPFSLIAQAGFSGAGDEAAIRERLTHLPGALIALLIGTLGILVSLVHMMSIAFLAEGKALHWKEALSQSFSRLGACIVAGILATLIVFGWTLLLIVPGIIWGLYFAFVGYAVALRGKNGKQALDYSKSLVKGNWWKVFGILLLISLIVAVIGLGASFILALLLRLLRVLPFGIAVGMVLVTLVQNLIGSFSYVAYTQFFLELDSVKRPAV